MNVEQALLLGKKELKQCGIESYSLDTVLLLMKATSFTKVQLYTKNTVELTTEQQKQYFCDLEQRKQGKPIAYITGVCEFMALPFVVSEDVLIPRADTEILVETVLQYHNKKNFKKVIDVCTGTGCIAVSLAKYSNMELCGVDISTTALHIAQKNAVNNDVCVKWFQSNLFETVPDSWLNNADAIVSNPPYIATKQIQTLMNSVKEFEPYLALDGGEDGLYFYKKIVQQSKQFLKEGAYLFFEIGCEQAYNVCDILKQYRFESVKIYQDLAGLDRVISAVNKA